MGIRTKQVDAYIAKAPPFAQPILIKLRELFHKGCPDVEESLKWGHLSFGHHGILGMTAAFKNYVRWGFWKHGLIHKSMPGGPAPMGMGHKPITSVKELPPDKVILAQIRKAVELNESGASTPRPKKPPKAVPKMPADLAAALKKNARAAAAFKAFSPGKRREYIEWIVDAKQADTRQRRVKQAAEWIARGKSRNWKYEKK